MIIAMQNEWCESGRVLILEFAYTTPSLNVMLRMHFRKKGEIKSKVALLVLEALWGQKPMPRARITYTRYGRILDKVNVYGSAKVWEDQIIKFGLLPDDNPNFVDLTCISAKGKPKTVIEVRECV